MNFYEFKVSWVCMRALGSSFSPLSAAPAYIYKGHGFSFQLTHWITVSAGGSTGLSPEEDMDYTGLND